MRSVILYLLMFLFGMASAQKQVPELWGQRVHDEAHVLKQATIDQLETSLKNYEDSTSNQIAILLVTTLDGDEIESFSIRVVEKWKLGQKGKDNGVLLLIAVDDHKMRIEVGKGLEGVLTDALSSKIIRDKIAPDFRRGDFDDGVVAGIEGITKTIAGEFVANDNEARNTGDISNILVSLFVFLILGIFTFMGLVIAGKTAWGLYAFLIPFWTIFPGATLSLNLSNWFYPPLIYIIGFPILRTILSRTSWVKKMQEQAKKSGSGGSSSQSYWMGSGGSGGGWDSGSSSFSGGGGSFGGGGSSGSW